MRWRTEGLRRLAVTLMCLVMVVCVTACGKNLEQQIAEQLELGERYLAEMDYEQAVVTFRKVIEMDAKNIDAYLGLGHAYEGQADQIRISDQAAANEYDMLAAKQYEKVLELNPADSETCRNLIAICKKLGKLDKIQELLDRFLEQEDDDELQAEQEEIQACTELIRQISLLCEAGDFEQVFKVLQGEAYQKLQALSLELGSPVFDVKDKKGLGLYPVTTQDYGNCMIYYGDYHEGLRQGNGIWMGYQGGNNYRAAGSWSGDHPNGSQEVTEWNSDLDEKVAVRVITGNVSDGLWDGPVQWTFERKGEAADVFPVSFTKGKWVILEVREGEEGTDYVVSDRGDKKGSMYVETPDELEGIEGFR